MTYAEIITSLERDLAAHRQELQALSSVLLGEGFIVADDHVRTVQPAAKHGGPTGRLALAPYGMGRSGTMRFTRDRAEHVAQAICQQGEKVVAIHVTDWHRRRIASLESTLAAVQAA